MQGKVCLSGEFRRPCFRKTWKNEKKKVKCDNQREKAAAALEKLEKGKKADVKDIVPATENKMAENNDKENDKDIFQLKINLQLSTLRNTEILKQINSNLKS